MAMFVFSCFLRDVTARPQVPEELGLDSDRLSELWDNKGDFDVFEKHQCNAFSHLLLSKFGQYGVYIVECIV